MWTMSSLLVKSVSLRLHGDEILGQNRRILQVNQQGYQEESRALGKLLRDSGARETLGQWTIPFFLPPSRIFIFPSWGSWFTVFWGWWLWSIFTFWSPKVWLLPNDWSHVCNIVQLLPLLSFCPHGSPDFASTSVYSSIFWRHGSPSC